MAFAAGAMIFIVVEEVIPESQRGGHTDLATIGLNTWIYRYDGSRRFIRINLIYQKRIFALCQQLLISKIGKQVILIN